MELEIRDLQSEALPRELIARTAEETARLASADLDRLSLVFLDDARIHDLNRRFRDTDRPTDVIAFEAEEQAGELAGEVIISVETARRQAEEAGHDLATELAWLVAHGVLHVTGMDDATEAELEEMLARQREVLARLGLEVAA